MNKFEKLYDKQSEFEDMLIMKIQTLPNKPLIDFDKKEQASFSKELALLLYQEVGEFVNAVGNYKLHKTKEDGKDIKEIKEEIADMFIFVLDMALAHKLTATELLNEIEQKQNKNFERQKKGY
jgi:NTP pyrophosphatase (non-canonical NTP hydrolase)